MKCQECRNEQDKPQVNPPGKPLYNMVTKKFDEQMYRAGIVDGVLCWYCAFPTVGRHI